VVGVGLGVAGADVVGGAVGVGVAGVPGRSLVLEPGVGVPDDEPFWVWPTGVAATPELWPGVHAPVAATSATAPARTRTRRRPPVVRDGETAVCIVPPCLNATCLRIGALH